MSAPERISVYGGHLLVFGEVGDRFSDNPWPNAMVEYVRADLLTTPQAEIARLTVERDAAMAGRAPQARVLLISSDRGVCVGGRWDGWMMVRHPDGQWVSHHKLEAVDPGGEMTDLLRAIAAMQPDTDRDALWSHIRKRAAATLREAAATIASLRAQIDRERAATIEAAAHTGYVTCAKTRHVTLGDAVSASISALHTDATRAAMDAIRREGYEAGVRDERAKSADLANAARDLADCCQLGEDADWDEGDDPLSELRAVLAARS